MKVRELINALLKCDMEHNVELITSNTDKYGRKHIYTLTGVDPTPIGTYASKELSIRLTFNNYDFDKEELYK